MDRKLLLLAALGLSLAACGKKAPAGDNGFNEAAATFNEAAAMNTSVVAAPADNSVTAVNGMTDANAAAPAADANAAAPAKP